MNGLSDFESIHADIPNDCCRNKTVTVCPPDDTILDGCLHSFLYRVYLDRYVLGTVAILAGFLMLMMLVSSVFICFDDDDSDLIGAVDYCIDDETDDQYFTQLTQTPNGDQLMERHEKHPAFVGRDLT